MAGESTLFVEFGIGDQRYGLPAHKVLEILRFAALNPIPSSAAHVRGALNLRGEMVVVTDLRVLLKAKAEERPNTPILLVEAGSSKVGLVADEIFDVISVSSSEIQARKDDTRLPRFVSGVLTREGHFLYMVAAEVLLDLIDDGTPR